MIRSTVIGVVIAFAGAGGGAVHARTAMATPTSPQTSGAAAAPAQTAASSAPAAPAAPVDPTPHPERFAGVWQYNEGESVDAATGKPERAAAERRVGRAGGAGPSAGGASGGSGGLSAPPTGGGYTGCVGCGGTPSAGDPRVGMVMQGAQNAASKAGGGPDGIQPIATSERMRAEARDLVRDLMEIAESYAVAVTRDALSFTDDLGRTLTYPTDGKKRTYHLSAVTFDARAAWEGPALVVHITAAQGFKMSQAFLTSADGFRLFVRVRVEDEAKTTSPPPSAGRRGAPATADAATSDPKPSTIAIGANRVYDRIVKSIASMY